MPKLTADERSHLITVLKTRFEENSDRHQGIEWDDVQTRLEADDAKLYSLYAMEQTGGEPDVTGFDKQTGEFIFMDCSPESPSGRRSLCYDRSGLESRKEHRPKDSALDVAEAMDVQLLTEEQYRQLQQFGPFDAKTSSWLLTPAETRKLGGAIFGDYRYGRVFVYHNGAQSYYGARGFRGMLRV